MEGRGRVVSQVTGEFTVRRTMCHKTSAMYRAFPVRRHAGSSGTQKIPIPSENKTRLTVAQLLKTTNAYYRIRGYFPLKIEEYTNKCYTAI